MIAIYYCIFALTTAITAWMAWFRPILSSASKQEVYNEFTLNPITAHLVYFLASFIIAPFLFIALIVPGVGDVCQESLYNIVHEDDYQDLE